VAVVADLLRRGTFAERGYRNSVTAVADLMGGDRAEARRRVIAAEQVCPRAGLDGAVLPAKLPATAQQFATGAAGLRHVEAIVRVLASPSAQRLSPTVWSGAEAELAAHADRYIPSELHEWGGRLVDTLDQDGPEPDDRPPRPVNEVRLQRFRGRPGGTLKGHFDDAAMFDAIAAVVDAHARPTDADDHRTQAGRQAEALADACGYVLDHADVPACGGRRPHLNVLVRLEDLENRARAACLDFGGTLSPQSLRMLCCDAAVVPIVLDGKGQPLDVGRATRAIPDGLRRAVAARDGGCARCGRPSSWCEVHHVVPSPTTTALPRRGQNHRSHRSARPRSRGAVAGELLVRHGYFFPSRAAAQLSMEQRPAFETRGPAVDPGTVRCRSRVDGLTSDPG